ncbi:MAG: hypothetical protein ACRBDL_07050 [Alphaproteobacteria bacterium]
MGHRGRNITINIDEIVFDGCDFPDYKKPRFMAAFQAELERLFRKYGLPRQRKLDTPIQWSSVSEQTAQRLAYAVYERLGQQV